MREADIECRVAHLLFHAVELTTALEASSSHQLTAENWWQKLSSALSRQNAAFARGVPACSTTGPGERIFPRCLTNEPVKLTAEMFTEANDEQ
jgi:hypothetical protein